jgi:hypothetical protein
MSQRGSHFPRTTDYKYIYWRGVSERTMKRALVLIASVALAFAMFLPSEALAGHVCVIPIAPAHLYSSRHSYGFYPRHRRCYYPRFRWGVYRSVPPYGYYVRRRY